MIVVSAELNYPLNIHYQRTRIDRWLKFCSYMKASEWGLLADGSLVYPRMHLFRYVMEGKPESYEALGRPGFWHESSRIFYADMTSYDDWEDAPLFDKKTVFFPVLPENVEFQDPAVGPYTSQKSINLAMETYFNFEQKQLIDVKRRIVERNVDIFFN